MDNKEKQKVNGWEVATAIAIVTSVILGGLLIQDYYGMNDVPTYDFSDIVPGFTITEDELASFEEVAPKDPFGRFTVCNTELGTCLIMGKLK